MANLVNGSIKKANLSISLGASGVIGTAANTVDKFSSFDITATAPNLVFTFPNPSDPLFSDVIEVGASGTNSFTVYNKIISPVGQSEFHTFRWNGTTFQSSSQGNLSGAIVAKTPHNSAPETAIVFDGIEIKWHLSNASGFDGIAIRTQSGTRSMRYSSAEFFIANTAADGGKSLWGSNNAWYNLPTTGATATVINATYPHAQNVTTTFIGMGNPALPNADMRIYFLYDDTNQNTYKIYVDKQGSTGEVLAVQTGTCFIMVEKIGITSSQIIGAANGNSMSGTNVELGGALNKNTDIAQGGFNFNLTGTGNHGVGTNSPTAKEHIDGTFTLGMGAIATIANQAANFTITNAQVEGASTIKIAQTTAGISLTSIAAPSSTATGRFLRIHNTGTANILGNFPIDATSFIDLQWNGSAWAKETSAPAGSNPSGEATWANQNFTATETDVVSITLPAIGTYILIADPSITTTATTAQTYVFKITNNANTEICHQNLAVTDAVLTQRYSIPINARITTTTVNEIYKFRILNAGATGQLSASVNNGGRLIWFKI